MTIYVGDSVLLWGERHTHGYQTVIRVWDGKPPITSYARPIQWMELSDGRIVSQSRVERLLSDEGTVGI